MYAIFEDSGTQIKASKDDVLVLDIRDLPEDATEVTFDKVILVGGEGAPTVGTPYVNGASVKAEIIDREFKDKKIDVIKFKRRKGYRRKQGHRQRLMRVKVTSINA
ncbi:MAG: hypothetical protein Tsb0013_20640 [Phycisphaerales bacterium]